MKTKNDAFEEIQASLKDAIAFAGGKDIGAQVYTPETVDVKKVRKNIGMTQVEFSAHFGLGLGTLRHWERGDRAPKGAALVLLNLIEKEPQVVLKILKNE